MVKETDVLLRTVVDLALTGRRSWSSVGDLAHEAGVGEKLAYKVTARVAEIGAITRHCGSGFSITDPERLLMLLSSRRTLSAARRTDLQSAQAWLSELDVYAVGGTRAAVHHLGGTNTIAAHAPAILYVPEGTELEGLPEGDGALVLAADARSLQSWAEGYTSRAQTYADLFAQPGWQASEFRRALWRAWFAVDDWAHADAAT